MIQHIELGLLCIALKDGPCDTVQRLWIVIYCTEGYYLSYSTYPLVDCMLLNVVQCERWS